MSSDFWTCPHCLDQIPGHQGHSCSKAPKPDHPSATRTMGNDVGEVVISPSQAIKLLSLFDLLKNGDLEIRGDEKEDVDAAIEALGDVAQEIALQVHA